MQLNKMREELTEAFLNSLQEEQLPWARGWSVVRHQNAISGSVYRGVNAFWLAYQAMEKCYTDPRWCTFKQANEKGWTVKKGEKGTHIEFWSMYDREQKRNLTNKEVSELREELTDEEFKERVKPVSNVYTVFNAEQIEGIPELLVHSQEYDKDLCMEIRDDVLNGLNVRLKEGGNKAFYVPSEDSITMPPMDSFWAEYNYLSTFLHEAGHCTGHESRMNRDLSGSFGTESYAREELRAEIASAFTTQAIGLEGTMSRERIDNHKAYIQSWIKNIKEDPTELFKAINDATKISDYLIEKGNLQRFIRKFESVRDKELEIDELEKRLLKASHDKVTQGLPYTELSASDREQIITNDFKLKSRDYFQGINGLDLREVELSLLNYVKDAVRENELNIEVSDVFITGSRTRGYEAVDSDLDVIVAYRGSISEDSLFNILNTGGVELEGVMVDFNPISLDKRVSLADYLIDAEREMDKRIQKLPFIPGKSMTYETQRKANAMVGENDKSAYRPEMENHEQRRIQKHGR